MINFEVSPSPQELSDFFQLLESRFQEHHSRYPKAKWERLQARLEDQPGKLQALYAMEITEGSPALLDYDIAADEYLFCDFAPESPKGRRSLCYDQAALEARKKFPPKSSAMAIAGQMGVHLMDEATYRKLQALGPVDTKTSSWLKTPDAIRTLGGAIFGDHRYGQTFIYHNGADSYYAARGFRAVVKL